MTARSLKNRVTYLEQRDRVRRLRIRLNMKKGVYEGPISFGGEIQGPPDESDLILAALEQGATVERASDFAAKAVAALEHIDELDSMPDEELVQ